MVMRFTEEHEWLRLEADGTVTVGITDYAQDALGDLVFVQLPELRTYAKGEEVAVLESVKAASNIAMPIDGEILEINEALGDAPEKVNQDPLDAGWFFRMRPADPEALGTLLTEDGYAQLIKA
ncbi:MULTISPECIES: glycine cleavage system protein GcvH [Pseudomonas]|uniref:Glycine cleavage system H protein n=1 Tax=Pseudomonas luteola TaxID=47886 RepID=A0A2X2F3H1_PSELU|nr:MULTISPECIES: glycine cleavage system protein GcvH [Pseudomonas]AYN92530.1 glycine cleavage system protein GcvH [Pseudomonas sp. LTJR-52]ENA32759.1 glycine cleavage system H protein [Pseudomonas sp. HPB0071]MBA1249103.1 glycine cleavage system protein GcvH [Pseudomonas zeshuii]MBF8642178.1 glycine cleavage system protein GcvH [Pseudomonas zeshuii]MBW5414010.1 glycine cleavage system protein GcvH [Pseudomonas sp. MAG002Y]